MARLNHSVPPSSTRASSLYRLTPSESNGAQTRYSPTNSDKENATMIDSEEEEPANPKPSGRGAMPPPSRQAQNGARAPLRPDRGEHNIPAASQVANADAPVEDSIEYQFYDPDQNPTKRRKLRQHMRENDRTLRDRRDELLQADNNDLLDHIRRADNLMGEVRQTSDATIDSRFLVNASDLALKKATKIAHGDAGIGIDMDEFVSKCITFMRHGGPLAPEQEPANTQARRQRRRYDNESGDEDDEDNGEGLDWAVFGELACFPNNNRPPVPGFLLGPLSVQKRVRTQTQRRARQDRRQVVETRPDELKAQDLQKAENSNLTSLCRNIRDRLKEHINTESGAVEAEVGDTMADDEASAIMHKHRLAMTTGGEPAVSLFDFSINPSSFGQTVENLFYISFLIRDGNAMVDYDSDGLPILVPANPRSVTEKRAQEVSKHQAIFSIDYETWQQLISAFEIAEPLIPHRKDEGQQVSAKGWYG